MRLLGRYGVELLAPCHAESPLELGGDLLLPAGLQGKRLRVLRREQCPGRSGIVRRPLCCIGGSTWVPRPAGCCWWTGDGRVRNAIAKDYSDLGSMTITSPSGSQIGIYRPLEAGASIYVPPSHCFAVGSVTVKNVTPSSLSAVMVPLWSVTICLAMARPSPAPLELRPMSSL